MKRRSDDTTRLLLAYVNIGEAEDHRFYWQQGWRRQPPRWLGPEDQRYRGSFPVLYWEADWQRIVFGQDDSYVDRILRAGFDGVYIDRADTYEDHERTRPQARREMSRFIERLSAHVRVKRPGFLVVVQNAEGLISEPGFLAAVDGLGKEDLFYGYDERPGYSPREETEFAATLLSRARRAGKLILTVDYVTNADTVRVVQQRARALGFIPYFTVRELDRLSATTTSEQPTARGVALRRTPPGQFFALTAPYGALRFNLAADAWRENVDEDEFTESTLTLAASYGLGRRWEIGALLPVARGRFPEVSGTGLGNIGVHLARSWSSADEGRNLLLDVTAALPTDLRSDEFSSAAALQLSLTGERYWSRIGLIGSGSATYAAEGGGLNVEYSAGVGAQASTRLFASVVVGAERSTPRAELSAEYLVTHSLSLAAFAGSDLRGAASAAFYGIAVNCWIWAGTL
jgi:cysteinyl-tRNA synthetase